MPFTHCDIPRAGVTCSLPRWRCLAVPRVNDFCSLPAPPSCSVLCSGIRTGETPSSRSAKENDWVAPAGTEPQAQLPVRGLTSLGGWASTQEGFVSEMAFLFEPRGLTLSGRQTTGPSCHPRLAERLRPIDYLSDQREKTGKGLAATARSLPRALSQGHGHLALPPCQGLPLRAWGLQVETGGGPLQSPCCPKGRGSAREEEKQSGVTAGRSGPCWGKEQPIF